MPPPDTTILPAPAGPLPGLSDTLSMLQRLRQAAMENHSDGFGKGITDGPQFLLTQGQMFLVVLGIILLLFFFLVFFPERVEKKNATRLAADAERDLETNYQAYHACLLQYNPYYAALSGGQQHRFLSRTLHFLWLKEFRFHSMQEDDQVSFLISAAAVQMTFGLKNYTLDYFPVIHVIRKEYVLEMDKETYYGHVSRSGIYIAWNHFLKGFENYSDCINVGLHEMAHAVSFDVFLGQCDIHDHAFRSRLEGFAEEGRPIFRAMRSGMSHLLDDYGATNFDEFWAVCVETFFENPVEFRRQMPDLYLSVAELLNQDPLQETRVIDPVLAGLA